MAISYVGGQVGGRAGATTGANVTFNLTGGSNTQPQNGDLVVIAVVVGSPVATNSPSQAIANPSGYSTLTQLKGSGSTYAAHLQVSYKRMGSTPDTSFSLPSTGAATDAQRWSVHVFRGVDATTPLDVAAVSATGSGTTRADPGSITPSTSGAWVYAVGGGGCATGASYTNTDLTDFRTGSTADNNDAIIGSGYFVWTSGAFDPAQFGGGSNATGDAWAAYTLALRPAAAQQFTRTNTGSMTPAGVVRKKTRRTLLGSMTLAGVLDAVKVVAQTFQQAVSGSITASGDIVRRTSKALSGTITGAGAVVRKISRRLLGSLTGAGVVRRRCTKRFAGSLTASAVASKASKAAAEVGSIAMSGVLSTKFALAVAASGAITMAGSIRRGIRKRVLGAITAAGALRKRSTRRLAGSITAAGNVLRKARRRLLATISPAGSTDPSFTFRQVLVGALQASGAWVGNKLVFVYTESSRAARSLYSLISRR